jgi:hypothetical protein
MHLAIWVANDCHNGILHFSIRLSSVLIPMIYKVIYASAFVLHWSGLEFGSEICAIKKFAP